MDSTRRCPACDGEAAYEWPGLVAPFIADFVLSAPVQRTALYECGVCSTRWFADRFTGPELERLYSGYREGDYVSTRHKHEPWYTEATNSGLSADPLRVQTRQQGLLDYLADADFRGPFNAVLDHGGDAGQFIPLGLVEEAYVFEVSGVASVPGVKAVTDEADLMPGKYDLVLSIHVLEHIPRPIDLLRQLAQLPSPDGVLYVEVPLERPRLTFVGSGPRSAAYLNWLRTKKHVLRAVDFYSTGVRVKAGLIPPLGFPKLHEHQNFFSMDGLRRLLNRAGFDVVEMKQVPGHGPEAGGASIAALARVEDAS